MEIVEILSFDQQQRKIIVNPLFEFVETDKSTKAKVIGELKRTKNPMKNTHKLENAGIFKEI